MGLNTLILQFWIQAVYCIVIFVDKVMEILPFSYEKSENCKFDIEKSVL